MTPSTSAPSISRPCADYRRCLTRQDLERRSWLPRNAHDLDAPILELLHLSSLSKWVYETAWVKTPSSASRRRAHPGLRPWAFWNKGCACAQLRLVRRQSRLLQERLRRFASRPPGSKASCALQRYSLLKSAILVEHLKHRPEVLDRRLGLHIV